ncbi:MAG: dephospho-CoA kinase [Lachnospiraceae bacterium]|nr:dephospho-CoA kinase [Lachnospiraceae bacterium]
MKSIGITGGVGSGKTEVLTFITKNYDARVIVADIVAKELEQPGQSCYHKLVEALGKGILDEEGLINAKTLAGLIFSDTKALAQVNAIVHPAVKHYILGAMEEERKKGTKYFVVEAALLIEEDYQDILDEMWYIYVSEPVRRKRLKESRGYSDQKIDNIMAAQKTDAEFRMVCDHVIDNNDSIEKMQKQVEELLVI